MKNLFSRLVCDDRGQDLIEYALLAGFIALVSIAGVTIVGTQLNLTYTAIGAQIAALAAAV